MMTNILLCFLLILVSNAVRLPSQSHNFILAVMQEGDLLSSVVGNIYNPFQANPMDKFDPGVKSMEVFKLNYKGGKTTDGRFTLPREFYSREAKKCDTKASTTEVKGASSYQKALQAGLKMEGAYDGLVSSASFQANADFQSKVEEMSNSETMQAMSTMKCTLYQIVINDNADLILNDKLVKAFKKAHAAQKKRWMGKFH